MEELSDDERSEMLLRAKDWLDAAFQHLTGKTTIASREHTSESTTDSEYRPDQQSSIESSSGLKILIAEDDFICRKFLQTFLSKYGDCFVAINGREAVEAVREAIDEARPYDLVCLDIMMPEMDGHEALEAIRQIENEHGIAGLDGVKVIMTTALGDSKNVIGAFRTGCEAYIVKPIDREALLKVIHKYLPLESTVSSKRIDSVKSQVDEFGQLCSDETSQQYELAEPADGPDSEVPVDYTALMKVCRDEDVIKEIADVILEEGPQFIKSLAEAITAKDSKNISYYAHKLKGMARHICDMQLSERAGCVERAGNKKDIEKAALLFGDVQSEIEKLVSFLSQENWMEIAKQQQNSRQAETVQVDAKRDV
jgi:two-component system chemotaxis response regulator CheY